jgi:hypothetical protein
LVSSAFLLRDGKEVSQMEIYNKLVRRFGEVKTSIEFRKEKDNVVIIISTEFRKEQDNVVIIISTPTPMRFRWWSDEKGEGFCDHYVFPCGCQVVYHDYFPCHEHLISPIVGD